MTEISTEYQRFCRAVIHVVFADSSKGVSPVMCSQYLQFLEVKFCTDTI